MIRIIFIDAGNCEIASYEFPTGWSLDAHVAGLSRYLAEGHNPAEIRQIKLDIL
jgi:hypothetical protein